MTTATVPAPAAPAAPPAASAAPAAPPPAAPPAAAPPAAAPTIIGGNTSATSTDISYKLELPKETLLASEMLEKTASFSKERGFSNGHAQDVVQFVSDSIKGFVEGQRAEFVKQAEGWRKEIEDDPALGKEKFKENVHLVGKFSEKHLSKETREFLNDTGFGNNKFLFADLLKLAKASADDRLVHGTPATSAKPKTDLEVMFPASLGGQKTE